MVPAVMAAGNAGGTTIVIMSSVLNRIAPNEACNKTNSIKDLRFLEHCKFTMQSSVLYH